MVRIVVRVHAGGTGDSYCSAKLMGVQQGDILAGGCLGWLAGGWLGMWWCGGVGDEAEEFVNLCVVSVTRLPPPTDSQFPWQVTFQSGRGILNR